ncbi:HSCARG dehydrogenase [Colletotrichum tofieldiae]|nr:HSCARG dehydrogenase [Colletotrichum tofieldiae]GKT74306.1 HSCARG dehydrogenase [Colletotrichum tofieldiae]
MSIVAVLGATGAQGGSVVNQLLQDPKWKVRGITRSVHSEKAKQLIQRGVDVVLADVNDEDSLVKAFEGVTAIFAVTVYWDSIANLGRDGAGEEEVQQLKNIANAASQIRTLKHFVLSALPPADKVSGGKLKVPHFDYKQKAVDWIVQNTPELWSKTTEFWPGWYTSNLAYLPFMKFMPFPGSQGYALAVPSSPSALLPIAGDLQTNCGIVVRGILDAGPKAYGKIAICITDYRPITDLVSEFEKITGRPAAYLEFSDQDVEKFWDVFGAEFASQLRWSESNPNWHDLIADRVISMRELGVEGKLVNFEQALEALKDKLI